MLDLVTIFVSQFVLIGLLGIQTMNVAGRHYVAAAITSFILGVASFHVTAVIAEVGRAGMFTDKWYTFLAAGPIAIVTAIFVYPRIKKYWSKNETKS